jgi:iron complex outermembrane recepter protein
LIRQADKTGFQQA